MLLAIRCAGCGTVGSSPCGRCVATMRRSGPVAVPPPLAACRSLLAYEGAARQVVAQIKYRNARAALAWLALGMAALVRAGEVDVVTWAPTTPDRRRRRGFDHAELLARRVAALDHLPCRGLLLRGPGPPQTGHDRRQRVRGPSLMGVADLGGRRVLVVDDVVTTGATLGAAGRALHRAGATAVIGLVAAHPP